MNLKIKLRIIVGGVVLMLALFLNWLCLPAWNLRSEGFWLYCISLLSITTIASAIADKIAEPGISRITEISVTTKVLLGIFIASFIIFIFGCISSLRLFNAVSYSNLIEIKKGDFKADIQNINEENADNFPFLDVETAENIGNRSISEIKSVSQYDISGEYNLINYKDNQYRLSPLEYSSFINTFNNDAIPGYVMIDSGGDSKLVQNKKIRYAPSDIASRDLKRHLRKRYPSYIFGSKYQFDIDNAGKPYYIASVMKPKIGLFGGKMVKSFIIVNANSGETKEYLPEKLPKWVDHAYSLEYLMDLAKDAYKYNGGFWNAITAKKNVRDISYSYRGQNINEDEETEENNTTFEGYNSIMTPDGVQFFTCVVSVNSDESALGFILANARTGEIKFYNCAGAEESTAQLQAESLYQNYGYTSSYPLIVDVEGLPTYVMSLKDKSKINKAYVMINVENYSISASGENLAEALGNYKKKLIEEGEDLTEEVVVEEVEGKKEKAGIIKELYQAINEGTTQFIFELEGDDNILYVSPISNNMRQIKMTVGTNVSIEYYLSKDESIGIVSKIVIH